MDAVLLLRINGHIQFLVPSFTCSTYMIGRKISKMGHVSDVTH